MLFKSVDNSVFERNKTKGKLWITPKKCQKPFKNRGFLINKRLDKIPKIIYNIGEVKEH